MPHSFDDIHVAITADGRDNLGDLRLDKSKSRGLLRLDQGREGERLNRNLGDGICQGLVVAWLASKRDRTPFSTSDAARDRNTAMGVETRTLDLGIRLQRGEALDGFRLGDNVSMWTRAQTGGHQAWGRAAEAIEEADYNFFNITIRGQTDRRDPRTGVLVLDAGNQRIRVPYAHAMGAWRPNVRTSLLTGKSKEYYLFDPNVGEFLVDKTTIDLALRMLLENYMEDGDTVDSVEVDGVR